MLYNWVTNPYNEKELKEYFSKKEKNRTFEWLGSIGLSVCLII